MNADRLTTVADIVASLPPLSELLGVEEELLEPVSSSRKASSRDSRPARSSSRRVGATATRKSKLAPLTFSTSAAVELARQSVHDDRNNWNRIRHSLTLPITDRSSEDIQLTLAYLRRIPFFKGASEADLLTIAGEMELVDTRGARVEVAYVMGRPQRPSDTASRGRHYLVSTFGESPFELQSLDTEKSLGSRWPPDVILPPAEEATQAALHRMQALHESSEKAAREESGEQTEDVFMPVVDESGAAGLPPDVENELMELVPSVVVLLDGKVLLELPTETGKEHFVVLPGDAFGYQMLSDALPVGARYITEESCTFLRVRQQDNSVERDLFRAPISAIIDRASELLFQQRLSFLTDRVKVRLFDTNTRPASAKSMERKRRDTARMETPPGLAACVRRLIPLRLTNNQVLVAEGDPSDALFFVADGILTVSRIVPLRGHSRCRGEHESVVMEVARLKHGEVCGELGLVGHNPDVRPGEGVLWSDDYWRDALEERFRGSPTALDGTNAKFLKELHCGDENSDSQPPSSPMVEDGARAAERDAMFATSPHARMATLCSLNESLVYRLDYDVCRAVLSREGITRLREYAKGYPSVDDLRERYEQQRTWEAYKRTVFGEALGTAHKH